jgi:5-methylcytosine-specific restriction endonuclease McrA
MILAIRENSPLIIIVLLFMCAFYLERIARKAEAVRYLLEYDNKQKYPHMWK